MPKETTPGSNSDSNNHEKIVDEQIIKLHEELEKLSKREQNVSRIYNLTIEKFRAERKVIYAKLEKLNKEH